jgi:hypothetical protein
VPVCLGRKPTTNGDEGALMSTKAVPVRVPQTAYSLPLSGSVQPQMSAALVTLSNCVTLR